MTRPAFGNHLMATITCPNTRPCMCTVHPGVMECAAYQSEWAKKCLVEMREFDLADVMIRAPVVEQLQNIEEKCSLEEAQRIVCVGRGIVKDPQKGMKLANELASLLGAQIAGSRAAIDAGWLDESRLIGQTGKSVRPALYIALGVSGAMQHLVGMKNSGSVLAINKDPNAPIFSVADYSMVGDVYQILPILIEELKNIAKGGTEHDR